MKENSCLEGKNELGAVSKGTVSKGAASKRAVSKGTKVKGQVKGEAKAKI